MAWWTRSMALFVVRALWVSEWVWCLLLPCVRVKYLSHFVCTNGKYACDFTRSIFMFGYGERRRYDNERFVRQILELQNVSLFFQRRAHNDESITFLISDPRRIRLHHAPFNENISLRLRYFCHYRHFGLGARGGEGGSTSASRNSLNYCIVSIRVPHHAARHSIRFVENL